MKINQKKMFIFNKIESMEFASKKPEEKSRD